MTLVVTPLAESDAQHAVDIMTASAAADAPDFPPATLEQFLGIMRHPWPGEEKRFALAWLDAQPVGYLELALPRLENRDLADFRLEVLPAFRRRGVGRALFDFGLEIARAEGRKKLVTMTVGPLDGGADRDVPGDAFARSLGASIALTDVRRRLSVPALDHAALDALVAAAWPKAAGYSLLRWAGPVPEEHVADVAYLDGRLMTDAPLGDLDLEETKVDSARFRAQEAAAAARGRRSYSAAARHDASGRVVALTSLTVAASLPWHAFQQITLVDPEHRGHRLGALVKVENLRAALAAEPALTAIDTWNAAVNSHMIEINEALGFRAVDEWHNWQLTL